MLRLILRRVDCCSGRALGTHDVFGNHCYCCVLHKQTHLPSLLSMHAIITWPRSSTQRYESQCLCTDLTDTRLTRIIACPISCHQHRAQSHAALHIATQLPLRPRLLPLSYDGSGHFLGVAYYHELTKSWADQTQCDKRQLPCHRLIKNRSSRREA